MSRNNDEWTRHTRQMRRLLIMIVLLLGLLASAVARRIIEGRRTEPPRLKSSSAEELAPEEARPRGLIAARRRAGTKPAQHETPAMRDRRCFSALPQQLDSSSSARF